MTVGGQAAAESADYDLAPSRAEEDLGRWGWTKSTGSYPRTSKRSKPRVPATRRSMVSGIRRRSACDAQAPAGGASTVLDMAKWLRLPTVCSNGVNGSGCRTALQEARSIQINNLRPRTTPPWWVAMPSAWTPAAVPAGTSTGPTRGLHCGGAATTIPHDPGAEHGHCGSDQHVADQGARGHRRLVHGHRGDGSGDPDWPAFTESAFAPSRRRTTPWTAAEAREPETREGAERPTPARTATTTRVGEDRQGRQEAQDADRAGLGTTVPLFHWTANSYGYIVDRHAEGL